MAVPRVCQVASVEEMKASLKSLLQVGNGQARHIDTTRLTMYMWSLLVTQLASFSTKRRDLESKKCAEPLIAPTSCVPRNLYMLSPSSRTFTSVSCYSSLAQQALEQMKIVLEDTWLPKVSDES